MRREKKIEVKEGRCKEKKKNKKYNHLKNKNKKLENEYYPTLTSQRKRTVPLFTM